MVQIYKFSEASLLMINSHPQENKFPHVTNRRQIQTLAAEDGPIPPMPARSKPETLGERGRRYREPTKTLGKKEDDDRKAIVFEWAGMRL